MIAILGLTAAMTSNRLTTIDRFFRRDFGRLPGSTSAVNGLAVRPVALTSTAATFSLCHFRVLSGAAGPLSERSGLQLLHRGSGGTHG
jgi:hypothetical protein